MDDEDWDTSVSVAGNYHYEQETSIGLNGSNGSAASDVRIQGGPGDSLVELQYERLKARYEDVSSRGIRNGLPMGSQRKMRRSPEMKCSAPNQIASSLFIALRTELIPAASISDFRLRNNLRQSARLSRVHCLF